MGARQSRLAKRQGQPQKSAVNGGCGIGVSPADQKPTPNYNFVITDYIVDNGGCDSPLFKPRHPHHGHSNVPGSNGSLGSAPVAASVSVGNGQAKRLLRADAPMSQAQQRPLPSTPPPPAEYADIDNGTRIGQPWPDCPRATTVRNQSAKRSQSSAAAAQNRPCPVHGNYELSPRRQLSQQQQQMLRQIARQQFVTCKAEEEDDTSAMDLEVDTIIEQNEARNQPSGFEAGSRSLGGGGTLMRGRRGAPPRPDQQSFIPLQVAHQEQLKQRTQQQLLQQQRLLHQHQIETFQQQQEKLLEQRQLLQSRIQQQQQQTMRLSRKQQHEQQILQPAQQQMQPIQQLQQKQQQQQQKEQQQQQQQQEQQKQTKSLLPTGQPRQNEAQSTISRSDREAEVQNSDGKIATMSRGRPIVRAAVQAQSERRPQQPHSRDDASQTAAPTAISSTTAATNTDRESPPPPPLRITLRRSRSRSQHARDAPRLRLLPALSQAAAAASGRGHRVFDNQPTVLYRPRYFAQRRSLVEGLERLHMFCDDDDECLDNDRSNEYYREGVFEQQRRPLVRRGSCPGKLNGEDRTIQHQTQHADQHRHRQEQEFRQPRRIADVRHAAELRRRCRTFSAMRGQPRDGPAPKSPLPAERRVAGQRAFYFFHIRSGGSLAQSEAFLLDPVVTSLASRHSCTLRLLPPEEAEDLPDGLRRVEVAGPRLRDVKRFLYYLTTSEETVGLQKQIQERHTLSRRLSRAAADSRSNTTASSSPTTAGYGGVGGHEARSHRDLLYLSSSASYAWSGAATPDTISSAGGSQQRLWRTNSEAVRSCCDYRFMPSGYV